MKKIGLIIISVLLFLVGTNYAKAALVEGDDVYHLDLTSDEKVLNTHIFDDLAFACLDEYFDDNSAGYEVSYDDNATYQWYTYSYNNKDLFKHLYNRAEEEPAKLIKLGGIGSDNFVIDVSDIDEDECNMIGAYGYNKIAVYFESDVEIPVINEYTLDLNNISMRDIDNAVTGNGKIVDVYVIYLIQFLADDAITPEIDMNNLPDLPFTFKVNGKDFLEIYLDEDTQESDFRIVNGDNLTTDDNVVYTREFLNENLINYDYGNLNAFFGYLASSFERINVVISHNPPIEDEEEEPSNVTPNQDETKKESKSEEKILPLGDNIMVYVIAMAVSAIALAVVFIVKKKCKKENK